MIIRGLAGRTDAHEKPAVAFLYECHLPFQQPSSLGANRAAYSVPAVARGAWDSHSCPSVGYTDVSVWSLELLDDYAVLQVPQRAHPRLLPMARCQRPVAPTYTCNLNPGTLLDGRKDPAATLIAQLSQRALRKSARDTGQPPEIGQPKESADDSEHLIWKFIAAERQQGRRWLLHRFGDRVWRRSLTVGWLRLRLGFRVSLLWRHSLLSAQRLRLHDALSAHYYEPFL